MVLCSAPWYSKTRRISLARPISTRYPRKSATRNTPSKTLTRTPEPTRWPTHRKAMAGPTTKMPTNSARATAIDNAICRDERRTSSGEDSFAEMDRALTPMASACPRAMMPRKNGWRRIRNRRAMEWTSCDSMWIDRSGLRGPLSVPALEPLHAAPGVDQLLLARVEGMAVRADLDPKLRLGGTRGERVPAGTAHGGLNVFGVDSLLHSVPRLLIVGSAGKLTTPAPWRSPSGTARWTWWPGSCPPGARAQRPAPARGGPGGAATPGPAPPGASAAPPCGCWRLRR